MSSQRASHIAPHITGNSYNTSCNIDTRTRVVTWLIVNHNQCHNSKPHIFWLSCISLFVVIIFYFIFFLLSFISHSCQNHNHNNSKSFTSTHFFQVHIQDNVRGSVLNGISPTPSTPHRTKHHDARFTFQVWAGHLLVRIDRWITAKCQQRFPPDTTFIRRLDSIISKNLKTSKQTLKCTAHAHWNDSRSFARWLKRYAIIRQMSLVHVRYRLQISIGPTNIRRSLPDAD